MTLARHRAGFIAAMLVSTLLVAGCQPQADFSARFVRYTALPDGTRVAVVESTAVGADPDEVLAETRMTDLEPGEFVGVRVVGKDWDEPQWRPTLEIVGRTTR